MIVASHPDREAVRIARLVQRRPLSDVAADMGVSLSELSRFEHGHIGFSAARRRNYLEAVFADFLRR